MTLILLSLLGAIVIVCSILDILAKSGKINKNMSHIRIFSLFNAAEIIGGRGEKSGDRIGVMNGVKTISLLGIIVTHVASIVFYNPTTSVYS